MEWVDCQSEWCFLPLLVDELVRCKAFECLETFAEVISHEEGLHVLFEFLMGLVVEAFDGCFFESPVHALDLPIGPWVLRFGSAMLNGVLLEGMNTEEKGRDSLDLLFC